jgi:hypothetical protein
VGETIWEAVIERIIMKLTICVPGIRNHNWVNVYNSIPNATSLPKEEYEMIFIGPYGLPEELKQESNVTFIQDWGSPTRCCQLGIIHAQGEYLTWIVDDATFCGGLALDKGFEIMPINKGIVTFKYYEGPQSKKTRRVMDDEAYWHFRGHPVYKECICIPEHYKLTLLLLTKSEYFRYIGGFDCCAFEQIGLACNDLAVRFQNDGAEVILGDRLLDMDFERGGLHKAIEQAVVENDYPAFFRIYKDEANKTRSTIDIHNWEKAPAIWERRFRNDRTQF